MVLKQHDIGLDLKCCVCVHPIVSLHVVCIHRCSQNCLKCLRGKSIFLPFELKYYIFWNVPCIKLIPRWNIDILESNHTFSQKEKKSDRNNINVKGYKISYPVKPELSKGLTG